MNVQTKYRVIVGPYHAAKRYAERRDWRGEDIVIVTRAHQLAKLDPALIAGIVLVKLNALGRSIAEDIKAEASTITALWPVAIQATA